MTEQEFETFRKTIQRKGFPTQHLGPITDAILRARFEREKLQTLITAAESVVESKRLERKLARWKQRLASMEQNQPPMRRLKKEIEQSKLQVRVPPLRQFVNARRVRSE